MELVLRTIAIYLVLLVLFRLAGKHTLAEATTFELVLLLVISEAVQQALVGDDFSVTTAILVITTFVTFDIVMSLIQYRFARVDRLVDGLPLVILADGELLDEPSRKSRVNVSEVLHAARAQHGIERLDQVRYAVLERSGEISIIPKKE